MGIKYERRRPRQEADLKPVEDVQGHADTRQIPINKVGIRTFITRSR